ncbi:MAG: SRPBCC family protein, partial [Actinomycetota bacterium]
RNLDFTAEVVLTEDFQQQEAIQRNIASGLMHEMVFGRNEPALQNFHASIDAVLARGAAE